MPGTVSRGVPVLAPTPALSNTTTSRSVANPLVIAGSKVSRFPRKWLKNTSGTRPPARPNRR